MYKIVSFNRILIMNYSENGENIMRERSFFSGESPQCFIHVNYWTSDTCDIKPVNTARHHLCFLDSTITFDNVNWSQLWVILKNMGIPQNCRIAKHFIHTSSNKINRTLMNPSLRNLQLIDIEVIFSQKTASWTNTCIILV